MYYINLLILAMFLSSCATSNTTSPKKSSGKSPQTQSTEELNLYKKAITLLNNNKLEDAKKIFLEFKTDRPELAGPYANLAIIALKNKEPEKAFKLVKLSLSKNPNLPQALNFLAYLEQIKGEIRAAEKHYKAAISNKKDYALAHYNLALLYDIYLQDINSAIPYYEKYMELINGEDKNTADWLEQVKRTRNNG